MSEKEKLSIGRELTDEELMEITGGTSFIKPSLLQYIISLPGLKYGLYYVPATEMYGDPIRPK
ncbi:hypothetical protein ABCY62_11900 [Acetivibrio clariflavus]|uniref:hypothetical protein n=1 Tax=Acetivibrio clariflavus TaxID=288965 RepID=UPI0031F56766